MSTGEPLSAQAVRLGVSREALGLYLSSDVIDLHIESYLWTRIAGYDLRRRHGRGLLGARFYSQVDLPRLVDAGLTGAVFSIATWPLRRQAAQTEAFLRNLASLREILETSPEVPGAGARVLRSPATDHIVGRLRIVKDHAGYVEAREQGAVAIWIGIQGGNALSRPEDLGLIPDDVVSRITLVHLTRSALGGASTFGADRGLTSTGRDYVAEMDRRRILLDLAHISRRAFREALDVHDRTLPAVVTHTGVCGVRPHWRNLEDDQIRAIAATGGVIGVIFHAGFLERSFLGGRASAIVEHMEHVIKVAGEDFVALGSDWDGMIRTPRDMPTVTELPVLVARMLARGWQPERIRKVLGENFLRVMRAIRPGPP